MIYNQDSEQDLEIKLKCMKLLWDLGYYTRKNIELAQFDIFGKDKTFTDIDVLGIKLDDELNWHIVIADCKSGKKIKNAERIFWLSGVKQAVNANRALFIRKSLDELKYIELAEKLGVTLLTLNQLDKLGRVYEIDPSLYFGVFERDCDLSKPYLDSLKSIDRKIYEYITKKYWLADSSEQIVTLISVCQQLIEYHQFNENTRSFLLSYVYSLLSISLLKFSKPLLYVSEERRANVIEQNLMGGSSEYVHRINLLSSLYDYMVNDIINPKDKISISEDQFIEGSKPSYLKYFNDIIFRISDNPRAAKYLPQIIDLFTYQFLGDKREITEDFIYINSEEYIDAMGIFRNFVAFVERTNMITPNLKENLKDFSDKYKITLGDKKIPIS